MFPPIVADSIADLAAAVNLPATQLEATIERFNRSVRPGRYDDSVLDDCRTEGLDPNKSHWARPLDTPPYLTYPLRPGITFTYLGLSVNQRAAVLMQDGTTASNIYAAGEIMAGNVLRRGYLAGIGMTIGTVFGRIAGAEAAQHATH
jgi:tricarballylate dehydrogenase